MIIKGMLRLAAAVLLSSGSVVATSAMAQAIIAPTSAVINLGGPGSGSINNTFDKSGLSTGYTAGVTNFDSYIASNPTHTTTFSGFEWFSNNGTTSATVTYNFGGLVTVDRLALWNEESSGIGTLMLSGSVDGTTFGSLGTFSPTDNPSGVDYPAQVFTLATTSLQYVRFAMSNCPQPLGNGYQACAIGEVAFRSAAAATGAVPEPATWGMMILGFGVVGAAMRRRLRASEIRFNAKIKRISEGAAA